MFMGSIREYRGSYIMKKNRVKVAYQGLIGSYSYEAAINFFPDSDYVSFQSFDRATEAVQSGDAQYVILPVENTSAGRVMEVHSILSESELHIVGEYLLPVNHCLFVSKAAISKDSSNLDKEDLEEILNKIVYVKSHPQALAQCKGFIKEFLPKAVAYPTYDTAGAVREVSSEKSEKYAAIGSHLNQETYNVVKLIDNIQDVKNNVTRFLILAKQPLDVSLIGKDAITTIKFETNHAPGSLVDALKIFQRHKIDLIKLETFMSGENKQIPCFYVDILASLHSQTMSDALNEFGQVVDKYSILGSYPIDPKRGDNNGFLK